VLNHGLRLRFFALYADAAVPLRSAVRLRLNESIQFLDCSYAAPCALAAIRNRAGVPSFPGLRTKIAGEF
jgi:hypothetical protein